MNKLYNDMLQLIRKRREEKGKMSTFMDRILDQEDKLDFDDHQLYFLGGTMMEGVRIAPFQFLRAVLTYIGL
jgi:cytochrome P450 family 619